nr:MAG: hypothetical protein [Guiyang Paspalum paspaloides tombus-like virus 2]
MSGRTFRLTTSKYKTCCKSLLTSDAHLDSCIHAESTIESTEDSIIKQRKDVVRTSQELEVDKHSSTKSTATLDRASELSLTAQGKQIAATTDELQTSCDALLNSGQQPPQSGPSGLSAHLNPQRKLPGVPTPGSNFASTPGLGGILDSTQSLSQSEYAMESLSITSRRAKTTVSLSEDGEVLSAPHEGWDRYVKYMERVEADYRGIGFGNRPIVKCQNGYVHMTNSFDILGHRHPMFIVYNQINLYGHVVPELETIDGFFGIGWHFDLVFRNMKKIHEYFTGVGCLPVKKLRSFA